MYEENERLLELAIAEGKIREMWFAPGDLENFEVR